ncbi:MAG: hypothetical protein MR296_03395 [Tenericutes bacterium]|nr:hypothetical protein [Mycoplasmatota bacterium]
MKKLFVLLGLLAVSLFVLIYGRYRVYTTIDINGYAITSDSVTKNLYSAKIDEKKDKVDYTKVKEYDTIYKRLDNLYVGEKSKKNINKSYPIFSKDNSRIINISPGSMLIDDKFNTYTGYNSFILTEGKLYNTSDNELADNNNYILLNVNEGIYINSKPVTITYDDLVDVKIKSNSIIYFSQNTIKYYELENGKFIYNKKEGIDLASKIKFGDKELTYEKLLNKLGLNIKKEEVKFDTTTKLTTKKEEEKEEVKTTQKKEEDKTPIKQDYVKPSITLSNEKTDVYSFTADLKVNDPAAAIKKNPTFEVEVDGSIYLRKTFAAQSSAIELSGLLPNKTFKIKGTYTYVNQNGSLVEKTFYEQEFKTKDISELNDVELTKDIENIYSKKVELTNLGINNKLDDEVLKGIKKITLKIGEEEYILSSKNVSKIKKLEKITYETSETLSSNTDYNYEIIIYDIAQNKLRTKNATGNARTAKQAPKVSVNVDESDLTILDLSLSIINKDDVNLNNLKYVISNSLGKIIKEENIDSSYKFRVSDLDANEVYQIDIYADYDLEDGKGNILNGLLGSVKASTNPLSTLGYVRISLEEQEITRNKASFELALNNKSTDPKLLSLLDSINISILDEEGNKVDNKIINGDDLTLLKQDEKINFNFENLTSNTKYTFDIKSNIKQGSKVYTFDVLNSLKSFKTHKKDAEVLIINKFANENMIDFDVKVLDEEGAIRTDRVLLEVRKSNGKLISMKEIEINKDYKQLNFDKLDKDENYVFKFIAEDYNVGTNNSTYEEGKILLEETITTEEGISGLLNLHSLSKVKKSKNLFNIKNRNLWTTGGGGTAKFSIDYDKKILYLGMTGTVSNRAYSYYIPDYAGKKVTISFKYKYRKNSSKTNSDYLRIEGMSNYTVPKATDEYKEFSQTMNVSQKGYIAFRIQNGSTNTMYYELKDIQIEEGGSATSYKDYEESNYYVADSLVNLKDKNSEILDDKYYIKIFKEDELLEIKEYSLNGKREVVDEMIKNNLEPYKEYKLVLAVKIRDKFYDISSYSVNTDNEVRGISSVDDLKNMHPYANYIVTKDLDLRNYPVIYDSTYSGTLDFQGHRVDVSTNSSYKINTLGTSGEIKNLDLHIYNNKKTTGFRFIYTIYGKVQDIMITLEETVDEPNSNVYLLTNSIGNNEQRSAQVSNFVVYAKKSLSCSHNCSLLAGNIYGTVKNGYIVGEPINATYKPPRKTNKFVGVFGQGSYWNSEIKNVYSNITINNSVKEEDYYNQVGNLVGTFQYSYIRNVLLSDYGKNRDETGTIAHGAGNGNNFKNSYYLSDTTYKVGGLSKISKQSLRTASFQEGVLNKNSKEFLVDGLVDRGFYAHVKLDETMPEQEYIEMPEIEDADMPDVSNISVLDSTDESVTLKVEIYNPSQEKISKINIQYLTTELSDIEYKGNTTSLTVKATKPEKYLSKYYVNSITLTSLSGVTYTRTYSANERGFNVTLYKPISTVAEWKKIPSGTTENYKLVSDLDFENTSATRTYFYGILDGQNHVIRNVKDSIFNNINNSAIIKNLNIENTTWSIVNNSNSVEIDNVHVKNQTVTLSSGNFGGIVASASYTKINNSSVTNLKIRTTDDADIGYVGGITGGIQYTYVENCYTQNIDIDVRNASKVFAIGGIVSADTNHGYINNSYSTGVIKTRFPNTGGIVGSFSSNVSNVISKVDIYTDNSKAAGIIGNTSGNLASNTISLGNLYTSFNTSDLKEYDIARTVGTSTFFARLSNYAWERQIFNGTVNTLTNGEILLSTEELKDELTYKDVLKYGDLFDYTGVEKGILPKLKDTYGNVMPYQEDVYIEEPSFEIYDVDFGDTQQQTTANVSLKIKNPNNYEISHIEAEGLKIKIDNNFNEDGVTNLNLTLTAEKAYDSYIISKIYYKNEEGKMLCYDSSYKLDIIFYKIINNFEDWQKMDNTYQNYVLRGNIDFKNKVNINHNINFNRFEGDIKSDGTYYKIKNLDLTFANASDYLFGTALNSFKNIDFENITLNGTYSGNKFGILKYNYARTENINFKDITINAPKISYTGIIGYEYGQYFKNINFDNINVTGASYIGAVGNINSTVTNININNSSATGVSYVGTLFGLSSGSTTTVNASHINVTATGNYVGGIMGQGGVTYLKASNIRVINNNASSSYTGGGIGHGPVYGSNITDTYVESKGSYVGIVNGYNSVTGTISSNSEVIGKSYVGGISGLGYITNTSFSLNNKITATSNYAGGIAGQINYQTERVIVQNNEIKANIGAGGIAGYSDKPVYSSFVNASITSTSDAGGIIGRSGGVASVYNNIVASSTITSGTNVGGIYGNLTKMIDINASSPPKNEKNLVVAQLNTTDSNGIINNIVGNNEAYSKNINNTYIYEYNTMNDKKAYEIEDENVTYVKRDDLIKDTFYKNNIGINSNWLFNKVSNGYFPKLNYFVSSQADIEIPDWSVTSFSLENENNVSMLSRSMVFRRSLKKNVSYHSLPEVYVYASDADKINVEFSSKDSCSYFEIDGKKYNIDKRTYTFSYNYDKDFVIKVSDGLSSKEVKVSLNNIKHNIGTNDSKYYFLDGKKLKGNIKDTSNKYNNIFNNYALRASGDIYDVVNEKVVGKVSSNFTLLDTKPLYEFEYNGNLIYTYYNYSVLNTDEVNKQLIVKNGNLEMVSSTLNSNKTSIIIDSYNDKNILSVLGSDGVIYNLKDKIKFPDSLTNKNIKDMTSSINNKTSLILIEYKNGSIYGFDYRTGTILTNKKAEENVDIVTYFKDKFTTDESAIDENVSTLYKESNDLYSSVNNTNKSNNYVRVYDPVKNKYVLYDTKKLTNKLSYNDKIDRSITLSNKFYSKSKGNKFLKGLNGVFILISILAFITMGLVLWYKNIYLASKKNKKA